MKMLGRNGINWLPPINPRKIGARLLSNRISPLLLDGSVRALHSDTLRKALVGGADRILRAYLVANDHLPESRREWARQRKLMAMAVLHTVDRLLRRRVLAPEVSRIVAELWSRALCFPWEETPEGRSFVGEHGHGAPWFLTIGPGQGCNLACTGCYANVGPEAPKLPWAVLDRILTEAKTLWGIRLVVLSGGEPLLYRSEGRDILDLVKAHPDLLFLMFTNGTPIDRATAERMAALGNITPAISVEGLRERTDARRGEGVFHRILDAMANLRRAGLPFGVSSMVTRHNCEEILSDRYIDRFFERESAFHGFLFHYMPIGKSVTLDLMPTPEQRIALWRRTLDLITERHLFLYDFWSSGPLLDGCAAAGRDGGYFYIDWNGKVMPCVFAPYSVANIGEVYDRGGTLEEVWRSPFFRAIRRWQRDYGFGEPEPTREGNWLRPCPVRDHHGQFLEWVEKYRPEPEDEAAREALSDEAYREGLVAYGDEVGELSRAIWQKFYLCGS